MSNYTPRLKQTQALHRERNKAKAVEFLLQHPCVTCGQSDLRVLDFDHLDPTTKKKNVGAMVNGSHSSWETILKEIAKCQVLCSNCHRKKTIGEQPWFMDPIGFIERVNLKTVGNKLRRLEMKHGSRVAYTYHKCRCVICRKSNTDYMKELRRNKPR